jgi:hypothetical protein
LHPRAGGDLALVRRIVVVLLVGVLVSGCGSKQSALPTATNVETRPAAASTPAGFTVRAVPDQGFAIAVPRSWSSIDAKAALSGASVRRFERENPAAAGAVKALTRPNSPMKFVAVDPRGREFATNVNILVSQIPAAATFEQWTSAETAQIAALKPTRLTKRTVELAAGRAYRLAYYAQLRIRGTLRNLAIQQYMVKRGPSLYVVTFTTEATAEDRFRDTFREAARTFTITA